MRSTPHCAESRFVSIIRTMNGRLAAVILSFTIAGAPWAQALALDEYCFPAPTDALVVSDDHPTPVEAPTDPADEEDESSTTAATGPVVMVEPIHRSLLASGVRGVLFGFVRRPSIRPTAPLTLSRSRRDVSNGRCVATSLAITAMPVRSHAPPATS